MGILDVPFNPSKFLPKWQPSTVYAAGALVVAPTGENITAKTSHTSGSTITTANWNYPVTGGGSVTFSTLTASGTTPTIPSTGVSAFAFTQDGTGSRTITWPAGVRWAGGTTPALSTAAGATDLFTFVAIAGGGWLGQKDASFAAPSDTTAPSALTGLTAGTATATSVPLSWTASTDNVGIAGYEYSTNGTSYTATGSTGTSYTVTGLTASTAYTLYIRAYDAAGNRGTAASVASTTAAASGYTAGQIITTDSFNRADVASIGGTNTDAAAGGTALAWVSAAGIGIVSNQLAPGTNAATQTAKINISATTRLKIDFNLAALPAGGNLEISFNTGATMKSLLRIAASATLYKEGFTNLGGWTPAPGAASITLDGTALSAAGIANGGGAGTASGVAAGGAIDNVIISTNASVTAWRLDDLKISVPA